MNNASSSSSTSNIGSTSSIPDCSDNSSDGTCSFEWCGGVYSWQDLGGALSVLCASHESPNSTQKANVGEHSVHIGSCTQPGNQQQQLQHQPEHRHDASAQLMTHQLMTQQARQPQPGELSHQQGLSHAADEVSNTGTDPWQVDSWRALNADGRALLEGLHAAESIPWVSICY